MSKQSEVMSPVKGVCDMSIWDILICYAVGVGAQEKSSLVFIHGMGALLSLVLLLLIQIVVSLPKVIQDPCLVSIDNAYMEICYEYHVVDPSMSLL